MIKKVNKLSKDNKLKIEKSNLKKEFVRNVKKIKKSNIKNKTEELSKLKLKYKQDSVKLNKNKYVPYYENELFIIRTTLIAIISLTLIFSLYGVIAFALPWIGHNELIDNLNVFGYPIFGLLMSLLWFTSFAIAVSTYRRTKLNDYQLCYSKLAFKRAAIILLIPSFGLSAMMLKVTSKKRLKIDKHFIEYWNENSDKIGEDKLYLKDELPMGPADTAKLIFSYFVLTLWALIIFYPVYLLVKSTFNGKLTDTLLSSNQYEFSGKQFTRLFSFQDGIFTTWMMNTLFIAIPTMLIVITVSIFAGYVYSRYRFRGKKASLITIMTLSLIPATSALVAQLVISKILKEAFNFDYKILIIALYSIGGISGNIFVLKGYLDTVSTEIDEAAKVDGASPRKAFFKVIFPLVKPMITVVGLGAFMGAFGDFILPALLAPEPKDYTVAVGLQSLIQSKQEALFCAGALIIALPICTMFLFLQRFLVSGLTKGGVKG